MAASSPAPDPLVLVAEDDEDVRELVSAILRHAGMRVVVAGHGATALELAEAERPDVVLADVGLPGLDGFELCRALNEREDAPPVVFLSAFADPTMRVKGLEAGGIDYVVKPFDADELVARLRVALRTKASHDVLRDQAATDSLTGLANRRAFEERAASALSLALRHRRPLSLLLVDIDHFKDVNDRLGHAAGDAVLRALAVRLGAVARGSDLIARLGGDELAVLLPETGASGAVTFAERLLDVVRAEAVRLEHGPVAVTVSVGVVTATAERGDLGKLLQAADDALYRAKRGGRDRVEVAGQEASAQASVAEARRLPCALVADDEEDVRELVAFCLEREGFDVLQAKDGFDALELALSGRPDIAVLDIGMPKLNGLELAAQLRACSTTRDMPILFLSARADDDDVTRGLLAGADDYVRKPFTPAELRRRMRDMLGV